jgi:hypothetical protein
MNGKIEKTFVLTGHVFNFESVIRIFKELSKLADTAEREILDSRQQDKSQRGPASREFVRIEVTFEQEPSTNITLNKYDEEEFASIQLAKTKSISMWYLSGFKSFAAESIRVTLQEGDDLSRSSNSVTVSGNSTQWVEDKFQKILLIIKSLAPRRKIPPLLQASGGLVFWGIIGYFCLTLYDATIKLLDLSDFDQKTDRSRFLTKSFIELSFIFIFIVGGWFSDTFVKWIRESWPLIEFDFGPDHLRSQKQKRLKLRLMLSILGIPLIFEVVKRYLLGWN